MNERETNIKFVGLASLEIKGRMVTNSVKEAMRIEDAKMSLKSYIEDKFQHNHHVIDFEVRNAFKCKEVTVPVLKCAYGCNHYGIRNALINDDLKKQAEKNWAKLSYHLTRWGYYFPNFWMFSGIFKDTCEFA